MQRERVPHAGYEVWACALTCLTHDIWLSLRLGTEYV